MGTYLSLEALEALDAIDRRGSFAAAAEALHRVPSALSYTVQRMEEQLGVAVFDRSGQRARLTPAGRVVLDQGRTILAASDALVRTAREVDRGWEAELTLSVDALFPLEALFPLIDGFQTACPHTRLTLRTEVLGGSWEALAEGRADLVLGASGRPGFADVQTRRIGEVSFAFVCAPDHPLTEASTPLTAAAIRPYRAVAVADSSRHRAPLTSGLLADQPTLTVDSMEAKIAAHRAGLGIGFLPRFRVRELLARGELVELPLAEPRPPTVTTMGWRSSHDGRALQWLLAALDPPDALSRLIRGDGRGDDPQ